jgi:hypothetical protein
MCIYTSDGKHAFYYPLEEELNWTCTAVVQGPWIRNSKATEKFQKSGVCISWLVFIVDVGTRQSRDIQLD